MTEQEKQEIISAVLSAIRTNSKTIGQLTPVSEMSDDDFLELNGGRKVSYGVLFANHMSNDDAQEAWEYLDTHKVDKDSRGLVEVHQATVVYLDAMGNLDGHALNGSDGLEYRSDHKQIHDFPNGKTGAPKQGAVYISKNNFKKFVWNGTDMEELKADECPLFVDYSEPVSFATLPVGGSYYVPSSHKIAVKIDASNTKTYDPLPDALYFFRDKGMIYTWMSSTNKWIPAGSGIKVVNNLTEGGEADALSAEQGKVLKGLIDNIGTGSIAAFANYAVAESVSALPATGVATTGYIVGSHIYAYVGTGGDTRDGKYQDLGALEAAGVSVTTAEDGTFTIHAGGNDYTVNLNHTHPYMCKLVVCEESGLPSTCDDDTIYAVTDNGEIGKLIIRGMEFAGGGGTPDNTPRLISPLSGTKIDFNGSSTTQVFIRGVNLGVALIIETTGDVIANVQTISVTDAANGVNVTLTKGSNFGNGTCALVIRSAEIEARTISIIDSQLSVRLSAIKLTGTQWMRTDWNLTAETDITMKVKFTANSNSDDTSSSENWYIVSEPWPQDASNKYFAYLKHSNNNQTEYDLLFQVKSNAVAKVSIPKANVQIDEAILSLSHSGKMTFTAGGNTYTVSSASAIKAVNYPLNIGALTNEANLDSTNKPFSKFILTIYEITISENGTAKRHYLPYVVQGVPGMLDDVTGHFMSSMTDSELEAEELTNNN